ncbi:MAG: class I SAM-dependent methyltransferase [Pirellulaceae bacterium]|nr:class I SAM-dependent methyltransferase [Pirellulaceae bacterium]
MLTTSAKPRPEWYDYPEYYDLFFQDDTPKEIAFLKQAFKRYGQGPIQRIIEPACGSGRLVFRLAQLGYDVAGFDLNDNALEFLRQRLAKKKLKANVYKDNMVDFKVDKPYDVALNTFNTFRHLLTEDDAIGHLRAVANALRSGGLFFLGLHVMPPDADDHCIERWRGKTGRTDVSFTLRVVEWQQRKRLETLRVSMLIRKGTQKPLRVQTEMVLRSYTLTQLRKLLKQVPEFELVESFDFWYEIDEPVKLSRDSSDTLLVLRKR